MPRHPEHAAMIERVLQIGPKRHERALVTYLTEPELDALIDAPDRSSWTGRRDHAVGPDRSMGRDQLTDSRDVKGAGCQSSDQTECGPSGKWCRAAAE